MDASLLGRAQSWIAADPDPTTVAELRSLVSAGSEAELRDRLDSSLEFGTAGLRGLLGAGPNRMNRAVVRRATAGVARHLLATVPGSAERGVVVARDARRGSDDFARDVASVLAGHGLRALVFPHRAPTPLGAFACLHLGAAAAVVVTASHNPPEYNGYKVYWGNGAQIVPPTDAGIAAEIEAAGPARDVPYLPEEEARARGLWRDVGEEVPAAYLARLQELLLHPGEGRDLRVVYTALHGVGGDWALRALREAGFAHVFPVAEQQEPDGRFPTVRFPNPEEPGALDLALALAEREGADLLLANDPDADRLCVAARDREGRMRPFTGNEVGVLLGHYLLTEGKRGAAPPLVLTTIVSSAQLGAIARELGARYAETLTGFKWIMNRALELEGAGEGSFAFGYEEALGYCAGRVVRDKDGLSAALVFADLAGWCRSRGLTPWEHLEGVQRRHGLYLSAQKSVVLPGRDGAEAIASLMEAFRAGAPAAIGGRAVAAELDYREGTARRGGTTRPTGLPPSNVLAYELADGSRVTLRPSGTEPKVKYYFEVREEPRPGEPLAASRERGETSLAGLVEAFVALARERGQPG